MDTNPQRLGRRFLLSAAGGALAAASYPAYFDPRWLELTTTKIALPFARGNRIRLLHLSDLHASRVFPVPWIDRAIRLGLAQNPDLICVTGDFVTRYGGFDRDEYVQVLRRLTAAAPVFGVMGNHDGGLWAKRRYGFSDHASVDRILEDSKIRLLHNASERVTIGGQDLNLVGVADLWSREIVASKAFQGVDAKRPTLLLAHNPDTKDEAGEFPWHLMLSGHTHGGQVIIPFDGPRFAPVKDKRYVDGLKPWRDRQIFVTRGVGNVGGVRFNCRPEVSILELVPA